MIVENTATGGNTAPYAQPFDTSGGVAFYEQGLGDIGSWSLGNGSEGLPSTGQFISILDGSTTFQLGPYVGNNVLFMDQSVSAGTLTLITPAAYSQLAILATSAMGGGTGSFTVHFVDGSTGGPFTYMAPDWYNNSGAALTHFGRIYTGAYSGFFTEDPSGNNPNLYQSTATLSGALSTKKIAGLSFTIPTGANVTTNTTTGIFAVSGKP